MGNLADSTFEAKYYREHLEPYGLRSEMCREQRNTL